MDDTTKHIIRSLARRQPRNVIITDLCERYRLKWDEAEGLVKKIEKTHASDITARQRPFLILLGSALALGGFALSAYMLYASFNGLIIFLIKLPIPYLGNLALFCLGLLACWGGTREVIRMLR